MKKLYSFLAALALTTPAFAQTTVADLEGDWTFVVYDNTAGTASAPTTLHLTATTEGADDVNCNILFKFQDCDYYIGGNFGTIDNFKFTTGYAIRFNKNIQEGKVSPNDANYRVQEDPFVLDGSDKISNNSIVEYDPTEEKLTTWYRNNGSVFPSVDGAGFEWTEYSDATYNTQVGVLRSITIVSAEKTKEQQGNAPAIYISLPNEAVTTGYTSATAANFTATPTVTAENVENFELHYSVYFDTTAIVEDEVVETQDGVYTIFVDNLDYADFWVKYYTLNVWAEAGEYKSAVVTKEIEIYEAPSLTISTKVVDITETTADIDVTISPYDIDGDLTYTISATSATGPAVEPVTGTSRTATLNITGLTPGTEYTYTVKGEANYDNKFTFESTRNVTFTTASGPAVVLEGNASAQVDELQNTVPDAPELLPADNWTVTATFNELSNELTINNFDKDDNTIKFTVNLTTGDAFAVNQNFEDQDYGTMYFGNKDSQLAVTAKVMNYGENQTRVVVDPWGEMMYLSVHEDDYDFEGWYFNVFYYNTDIILDGIIPGLQYNGPSVTIDNVRWVAQDDTSNSGFTTATTDFYVTVATEDLADDAEVTVYYKGPKDSDFQVAEKSGDEYTFTLYLTPSETEYTVTVYAASGIYTSDEVEVQFLTNTGVDNVIATPAAAVRYYNLQGIEVTHPAVGNAYIKVEGTKATKVVVK